MLNFGVRTLAAFPQSRLMYASTRVKLFSFALRNESTKACACSFPNNTFYFKSERKFYMSHVKVNDSPIPPHFTTSCYRSFSSSTSSEDKQVTEGEQQLTATIKKCFPNATKVIVEDISGGCGSMYSIFIEAPDFKGLSTVKQHLLVNKALNQEIKSMHGIRIQTAAPKP